MVSSSTSPFLHDTTPQDLPEGLSMSSLETLHTIVITVIIRSFLVDTLCPMVKKPSMIVNRTMKRLFAVEMTFKR